MMNRTYLIISLVVIFCAVPAIYYLKGGDSTNTIDLPPEHEQSKSLGDGNKNGDGQPEVAVALQNQNGANQLAIPTKEELDNKYKELPDYRNLAYDDEELSLKRQKLQNVAESFQKETMKKLEGLSNREDLSPEEMMNMVYKDDPNSYSEEKRFYLEQIAKPLMEEEEGFESDVDLSKVLSKAYDLLEEAAPEELKVATASYQKIPGNVRIGIKKEMKEIHRFLASKSGDELKDIFHDVQNGKTDLLPGMDKLLEKADGFQNEVGLHVLNSIKINSISK